MRFNKNYIFDKKLNMGIQTEKLEVLKLVLETDNSQILEIIRGLFSGKAEADFWESLSDIQKDEVMLGIKEIENGEVVEYDDFMKSYR